MKRPIVFSENDDQEQTRPSKQQKHPDSKQKSRGPKRKHKHKGLTQSQLDLGDRLHRDYLDGEEEEIDYAAPGIKDGVNICVLTPPT